jgi:gliding motility-associated lipoprotein GldH
LFLFVDFQDKRDTVEIILSEKSGRWIGRGFGDIKEQEILFKDQVFFSKEKQNKLFFEQAMRYGDRETINELKGIIAIGVGVNQNDK